MGRPKQIGNNAAGRAGPKRKRSADVDKDNSDSTLALPAEPRSAAAASSRKMAKVSSDRCAWSQALFTEANCPNSTCPYSPEHGAGCVVLAVSARFSRVI